MRASQPAICTWLPDGTLTRSQQFYHDVVTVSSMPLYFFHLYEREDVTRDFEGTALTDFEQAKAWALRCARDIMSHGVASGCLDLSSHIEVENDETKETSRVPFCAALQILE